MSDGMGKMTDRKCLTCSFAAMPNEPSHSTMRVRIIKEYPEAAGVSNDRRSYGAKVTERSAAPAVVLSSGSPAADGMLLADEKRTTNVISISNSQCRCRSSKYVTLVECALKWGQIAAWRGGQGQSHETCPSTLWPCGARPL